jgi:multiple sugar transport system substrate-binding protein
MSEKFYQQRLNRRDLLVRAARLSFSLGTAGSLLQACDHTGAIGSEGLRTLSFANWASAETTTRDDINRALAVFERQNDVQVNNIGMSFNHILDQLIDLTQVNVPIDVMELSGNMPFALAGIHALENLGPFVSQEWYHDAFPNSFAAGTYKGVLYAVPFSITPHGFWYNKHMMNAAGLDSTRPPRTMDELNQAMETLRERLPAEKYPIGLDTSTTDYALVAFWPWIWTFGGNPLAENGRGQVTIKWTDDGTVAAFQWLQDAVRKKWTPANLALKAERDLMGQEMMVFKMDGPYLPGDLADVNPTFASMREVNQVFGLTTTPLGPGITHPVTCADIHNLGMSNAATNKDLAWKLINFLTTSREVITAFLIPEGGVLPYRSYNTNPQLYRKYYADPISLAFINAVIPSMRPPAFGPHYTTAALFVVETLQKIAYGAPVRESLSKLNDQVKDVYR